MTVLDKSVEYRPLLMIIPRKRQGQVKALAQGYTYCSWDDSMKAAWAELQFKAGLYDSLEEANQSLDEFLQEKEQFISQFLFVCNDQGELVGSAGLWQGNHFGQNRLRVHYVAVSESAQHQGIASAMVSKLIAMYDQIPSKYPLYLATQTNSYGAIAMYSHLGFTPYLGAWRDCSEAQSKDNWELATEFLREKTKA